MPYDFEDGFNQKLKKILGTSLPKKINSEFAKKYLSILKSN